VTTREALRELAATYLRGHDEAAVRRYADLLHGRYQQWLRIQQQAPQPDQRVMAQRMQRLSKGLQSATSTVGRLSEIERLTLAVELGRDEADRYADLEAHLDALRRLSAAATRLCSKPPPKGRPIANPDRWRFVRWAVDDYIIAFQKLPAYSSRSHFVQALTEFARIFDAAWIEPSLSNDVRAAVGELKAEKNR